MLSGTRQMSLVPPEKMFNWVSYRISNDKFLITIFRSTVDIPYLNVTNIVLKNFKFSYA